MVGGLNLYSSAIDAFGQDVLITAHIYATHAGVALALRTQVSGLETARQTRHSIGIAQGLLIYRYGQTEEISFQVLRRLSSHKNIKLREVANQVITEFRTTGKLD